MRITINIEDELHQTAKYNAAKQKMTLSAFVEEALRLYLTSKDIISEKTELKMPTAGKGGLRPGVNLDQSAVLMDILEGRA